MMWQTLDEQDVRLPVIRKKLLGKDVSHMGAFSSNERLCLTVDVKRALGACAVVLRLCEDGRADRDLPLSFVNTEGGVDTYEIALDLGALCGKDGRGLFYYELLFLRGEDTLFTDTYNNVDFTLSPRSAGRFRLLCYRPTEQYPAWFCGGVMYHVFVDRFCCGEGSVSRREDAVINTDWENGIPQYPEKPGDRLSNNVFFGGNLWGVAQKLDYLQGMGVSVLYLSPIFRAYSNHKYDTGDYEQVDEMFGGNEALRHLLCEADQRGMRVILDGVFNHTGDNSRYFDRYGAYGGTGAYTDPASPYRTWFRFRTYPNEYETWWGIDVLPKLNHASDDCRSYFTAPDGIGARYVAKGTAGWRLDVADELSDTFLDEFCASVRAERPDALIIGEVWENAADKVAYGRRRRYLQGGQLDSVMNYPLRSAILDYLRYRDASILSDTLKELYASYPRHVSDCLMNILGTHDTERVLSVLGSIANEDFDFEGCTNEELATLRMTEAQRERALRLLRLGAVLQFTVFGVPSVYYGDEAGMEGYRDPFCRLPYPWGRECHRAQALYRTLGDIRRTHKALDAGEFRILSTHDGLIVYEREKEDDRLTVAVNRGEREEVLASFAGMTDLLTGCPFGGRLLPDDAVILS